MAEKLGNRDEIRSGAGQTHPKDILAGEYHLYTRVNTCNKAGHASKGTHLKCQLLRQHTAKQIGDIT